MRMNGDVGPLDDTTGYVFTLYTLLMYPYKQHLNHHSHDAAECLGGYLPTESVIASSRRSVKRSTFNLLTIARGCNFESSGGDVGLGKMLDIGYFHHWPRSNDRDELLGPQCLFSGYSWKQPDKIQCKPAAEATGGCAITVTGKSGEIWSGSGTVVSLSDGMA